jgi:hypothetical protein
MISNADVIERLGGLLGKELTTQNLHEAIFCEAKHQKLLRRFTLGKYNYIEYQVKNEVQPNGHFVADILISGNPNTFRVGIQALNNGTSIITSEPRVSYSYL